MLEKTNVKTLENVVVRFSGDSGDGMQPATFSLTCRRAWATKSPLSPTILLKSALRKAL